MNYVFKKEKVEVDAWIAGLDESAEEALIGEAALAEKRRLDRQVEKEADEEQQMKKTPKQLLEELLHFILPGEKITTALRRLSGKNGR